MLGLGYIGLPTACSFANAGLQVLGVDTNKDLVAALNQGRVHIQEPGLAELAKTAWELGNLTIADRPGDADAFVIAVPTPVTAAKKADLTHVVAAAEAITPHLASGNLVILESTCPARTTLDVVAPILERSGMVAGADFLLAYSPERALPGRILKELVENARVIGGVNSASAEAGSELYRSFVTGEILLTDATTAEMVKLMENTYRDINIAAANEFSHLAESLGVNVWQAIELANKHPRVEILQPGPGVGGHCTGVDPWFLVESAPDRTPMIQQSRTTNDRQPQHATRLIERAAGGLSGKQIATLGLAYKPDVGDLRESPAIKIVEGLAEAGANVRTFEPFAPSTHVGGSEAAGSLEEALKGANAVALLVNHAQFVDLDPQIVAELMEGKIAIDLRGVWDPQAWASAGFELHLLGVGTPRA